jgi:hypothetical protein
VTILQCDECHNTSNWTSINFDHNSGNYPGDHNSSVVCLSCHTSNSQNATWNYGAYKPDCAGCHANKYVRDQHRKYDDVDYTVSELRDCSGACHEYEDSSMTRIKDSQSGEHRTTDGGF